MTEQASAAAPAAAPAPIDRIKAFLSPQQEAPESGESHANGESEGPPSVARSKALPDEEASASREPATREDEGDEAQEVEAETIEGDEPPEDLQLSSLKDLADATGLELEKLMDLTLPVKVDGKEGTANLRDLLRSYQLDSHISKKLESLDSDRKTFEAKRAEAEKAAVDRLQQLDFGVNVLERALLGEYGQVDWQKLQAEDPARFNALYVGYQQKFAELQQIAGLIKAEQQTAESGRQKQAKAWQEEQETLLKAKIPEWSNETKRAQDKAAILEYLKGHGVSPDEYEQLQDHRYALIVRDAWKWASLQKEKPATLKKVKAAPKILKPGTTQSRESRETLAAQEAKARLRRTGRVSDAAKVLKGILGAAQR